MRFRPAPRPKAAGPVSAPRGPATAPPGARAGGAKDIGYYSAEAYEGLVTEARAPIEIGRRYFFQPRLCMLQWRHSGLVNYVSQGRDGIQVRLEGLWIG